MSKIRVYQLAKELNVTSKDMIEKFAELGIEVHNHMSTLEDSDVEIITTYFIPEVQSSEDEYEDEMFEDEDLDDLETDDEIAVSGIKVNAPEKKIEKVKKPIRAVEAAEEEIEEALESKGKRGGKGGKAAKKRRAETDPAFRPQDFNYENDIVISTTISVSDFARELKKQPKDIIMKLMNLGVMATLNQDIDFDTAELIASDYGVAVSKN